MKPPSTLMTCPVTALAASDASSAAIAPNSSGSTIRFWMFWLSANRLASAPLTPIIAPRMFQSTILVLVHPGHSTFTLMPCGAAE